MASFISPCHNEIARLGTRHRVRRLALFGSSTGTAFDPATSDIDVLLGFARRPAADYADRYFGLREELAGLFGRDVELVAERAVRNPFFLESVRQSREALFAA